MNGIILTYVLSCFIGGVVSSVSVVDYPTVEWVRQLNVCEDGPKGRVPWIIHVRNPDYGWKEHTHRANIALAVNGYRGESQEELRKMELQLEVELTLALLRNGTSRMHENDLALYIHALLATGKNPRNFHCTDLVEDLLHRVDRTIRQRGVVHPFLVLALCNAHAVTQDHLESIVHYARHQHSNTESLKGNEADLKALTLKAFACAASLNPALDKFRNEMSQAEDCLRRRQKEFTDGSFGNVYTTSLAVQAMIASNTVKEWNKNEALDFLERESIVKVNMLKAYYIEMALNAESVNFIKDLYNGTTLTRCDDTTSTVDKYITYSIKKGKRPDFYITLTVNVDPESNFFDIMNEAARISDRFSFSYTLSQDLLPVVHMVSGTPNDVEKNMFWRLCRQYEVDHDRHTSSVTTYRESPQTLVPRKDEHIIFWYLDTECPK